MGQFAQKSGKIYPVGHARFVIEQHVFKLYSQLNHGAGGSAVGFQKFDSFSDFVRSHRLALAVTG
ncbi:hypothetical protein [Pseudomonas sp. Leaf129]|uniref:hypothetical protein n=1 Tax=Pseudomonas sp. Leaf129 TaxID=1736268 RepID=UPI0012E7EA24|nr:hypothetical protein [Pseudomonas sp. Leaf129]